MKTAEQILKDMPSIKQGLDDFYGRQTVTNALNLALNQGLSLPIASVSSRRELLLAFIKKVNDEFPEENWDYLDFIAERMLGK